MTKSFGEIAPGARGRQYETAISWLRQAGLIHIVRRLSAPHLPLKTATHATFAGRFAWNHRDPFDRFLAAQAGLEDLHLVTSDKVFADLGWIQTLW